MSREFDARLQTMFADANMELDGANFVGRVMTNTLAWRNRLVAALAGLSLVVAICVLVFNIPLLQITQQVSLIFTTALIDVGEGWTALLLAPVNNIGSLLILTAKALRIIQKKMAGASYVN